MTEWSVYLETVAGPDDDHVDPDVMEPMIDELMDFLEDLSAVPTGDDTSWSVQVTVQAPDAQHAAIRAVDAVNGVAAKVGLPATLRSPDRRSRTWSAPMRWRRCSACPVSGSTSCVQPSGSRSRP
jgi:hypothetical protein